MNESKFPLLIISGPTAVGKTACAIEVAKTFGGEIISADSRQFYKDLDIGTAKPSAEELKQVPHHFIDFLGLDDEYTAGQFEKEALHCIQSIHKKGKVPILVGGSGMYIKAVVAGLDALPTNTELRTEIELFYNQYGIEALQNRLKNLDSDHFKKIDQKNQMRLIRAIEVVELTGKKHSELLTDSHSERSFVPVYIGLNKARASLYDSINKRVDWMIENGLVAEARSVISFQKNQALQTVGYKELFPFFNGVYNLDRAVELIKRNTRRYAKRQLTWLRKIESINWFQYDDYESIELFIKSAGIPVK